MLIKNFGHLWQRRFISIGTGGKRSHLKGTRAGQTVDFREQIGVYILYTPQLIPIYVGQAGKGRADLFTRINNHQRDHLEQRWTHFSWFGLREVRDSELLPLDDAEETSAKKSNLLNEFEAILLTVLEPTLTTLNKQAGKWMEVREYRQLIDVDLEEVTQYEIFNKIDDLEKTIIALGKRRSGGRKK